MTCENKDTIMAQREKTKEIKQGSPKWIQEQHLCLVAIIVWISLSLMLLLHQEHVSHFLVCFSASRFLFQRQLKDGLFWKVLSNFCVDLNLIIQEQHLCPVGNIAWIWLPLILVSHVSQFLACFSASTFFFQSQIKDGIFWNIMSNIRLSNLCARLVGKVDWTSSKPLKVKLKKFMKR